MHYLEYVTKGHIATHTILLNQARAWFLKIDPVQFVCMRECVCVSAPEAINNYWRDVA